MLSVTSIKFGWGVSLTAPQVVAWLSERVCFGQRSYSMSGPVNTWMGDRLTVCRRVGGGGINHLGM